MDIDKYDGCYSPGNYKIQRLMLLWATPLKFNFLDYWLPLAITNSISILRIYFKPQNHRTMKILSYVS